MNQVYPVVMLADLHTHTTASDGKLTPDELIAEAHSAGVSMLAITDHDTINAYKQLSPAPAGLEIVPGIELSSRWRKLGIHILGLHINPQHPAMLTFARSQHAIRHARAEKIAARLEKLGYTNMLEGAKAAAGDGAIGRPHFARYLVESGQIKSEQFAFKKLLGQGKIGDVREEWPETDEVISQIKAAGGVAVLAHPAKYKLTNLRLEELVRDFAAAGGAGLEVISGKQALKLTEKLAGLASRNGLAASCGSDFHQTGQSWASLGQIPPLPENVRPIWELWQNRQPDKTAREPAGQAAEGR